MKHLLFISIFSFYFTSFSQQLSYPMDVKINLPGSIAATLNYGAASDFGPVTMSTVTGNVAWGYTAAGDSLACAPITTDLTGKIALVRRGACDFSAKVYEAQQAGAIGCIILNNSGTNEIQNMTGVSNATLVTIPSAFISVNDGILITNELEQGNIVNMSFYIKSIRKSVVSFANQTPLSQANVLTNMYQIVHNNTNGTLTNVVTTLSIKNPLGIITNFTKTLSTIAPGVDSTLFFNSFTPTILGEYTAVFKSGLNLIDSTVHNFTITENTFSLENGSIDQFSDGYGLTDLNFQSENYYANFGSTFFAGPNGYIGDSLQASFALKNANLFVGEEFLLTLYTPFPGQSYGSQTSYNDFQVIGEASHIITAADTITPNMFITETLKLFNSYPNTLDAYQPYLLVLSYSGDGSISTSPKISISHKEDYISIDQIMVYQGTLFFGGWNDYPAYGLQLNLSDCAPTNTIDIRYACQGSSVVWIDGVTYTSNNNSATHTLQRANGCDSIVTLNLNFTNTLTGTDVIASCDPIEWIDGNTYTENNSIATFMTTSQAGCDSLVTLNYTVLQPTSSTDVRTGCGSFSWINGTTYTSSNTTATHIIQNSNGCDSVITLNLTIYPIYGSNDVIQSCNPYQWINGVTYTNSTNTPTWTVQSSTGCDSVLTLNLTIGGTLTTTDAITSCVPYQWIDGNTYSASNNTATHLLTAIGGCDSIVTLDLTIEQNANLNTTITSNNGTLTANLTGATSYQWIDCNNGNQAISGETNQSFTATSVGSYAVEISNNGCTGTSDCQSIQTIGLTEKNLRNIELYPNPTGDNITINLGTTFSTIHYEVIDLSGKVLIDEEYENTDIIQTSLIDFSNGIYYIHIKSEGIEEMIKVIKK